MTFPENAKSPKYCVIFSCGAKRASSERLAACTGAATRPTRIANPRKTCSPMAENGFDPAIFSATSVVKKMCVLSTERMPTAPAMRASSAKTITALGPSRSSRPTADQCAKCADKRQHDAEDAKLQRSPSENRRSINPAECEDGGEAIGVEHACDQKDQAGLASTAAISACPITQRREIAWDVRAARPRAGRARTEKTE